MAHQTVSLVAVTLSLLLGACASAPASPPPEKSAPSPNHAQIPAGSDAWGTIHSARFDLLLPLPDANHWTIDDRSRPELVGVHAPTHSVLLAKSFFESELVNRARCEQSARDQGLVPKATREAHTIEDAVVRAPADFDTRIWVAMRAGQKEGELVGDLFVFGAHVRRCIFVHYATIVASEQQLDVLSERLAAARLHIEKDLKVDAIEAVARDAPR